MADASKTFRHLMLGKINLATVTQAHVHAMDSIGIDANLVEAAGFFPNEKVEIYNITNGSRFATHVTVMSAGSGEVTVNGSAAHLVNQGDMVTIVSSGWMKEKQALKHVPRVVSVNESNAIATATGIEKNEAPFPLAPNVSSSGPKQLKVPKALRPAKKKS
jgi:aspartate 1-decarboxylase